MTEWLNNNCHFNNCEDILRIKHFHCLKIFKKHFNVLMFLKNVLKT